MSHYFVIELEWIFQTKKYDDDFELILSMHTLEKYNKWAVPDMGQPPAVQQVEIGLTEPQKNPDLRITITQPQQLITLTVSLNQIGISREIDVQCSPNSFIQELKNMIYEKLDQEVFEPCRWSLVFNDTVCQENILSINQNQRHNIVKLFHPTLLKFKFLYKAGKIITLNCNQNDTIQHIKALFYQKEGYYCRTLITGGQCLQNNHQLSDYSIQNEQTLQMVYTLKGGEGPPNNFQTLNIFIRLKDNHKIGVQVSNDCKIADIKTCIQNDYGISFKKMQLTFNGINLQDGKDISDYQIFRNATLNIIDPNKFANDQNLDTVIISLIINKNQYIIPLDKSTTVKSFKRLVSTLEKNDKILSDSSTIVICNGQLVSSDNMTFKNLPNQSFVLIIEPQFGSYPLTFMNEIYKINSQGLDKLKSSLSFIDQYELNYALDTLIEQINIQKGNSYYNSQFLLENQLAIKLYTSNLIYHQLNQDLRDQKFEKWKYFLKFFLDGLKYCSYYKGKGYRGINTSQCIKDYQIGKTIQWQGVSSISKNTERAQQFSGKQMLRILSSNQQQEIVLSPYSNFEVLQVVKQNQPIIVKLKEIPFQKYQKVLLWVDDQPENNFWYAQEIEQQQDISIVFCISTQDALKILF